MSRIWQRRHTTRCFITVAKSRRPISIRGAPRRSRSAPVPITAVADSAAVLAGSTNNVIDVLANDTTSPATGQSKAIVSVTQPAHGTVTFSPNNVAFYTPASDFVGTDTFTYTAQNTTAGGGSPTSTASVTVTVGSPITAVNDTASMIVGGFSTTIDVLANDTTTPASGQTKSLVSVTQPGHGSATISNNQVVYQPATGYVGTDSFTYTARNTTAGTGSLTSTATVSITINPVTAALMHYQVRVVP